MTITIVQTKTNPTTADTLFSATPTPSLTFDAAPTDTTNYLVAVLDDVTPGTVTANTGWTKVQDYPGSHSVGPVVVGWKKVGVSESATQTPFTTPSSQGDLSLFEVAGLDQTTPFEQAFANERGSAVSTNLSAVTPSLTAGEKFVAAGVRTGGSDGGSLGWPAPAGMTTAFNGFGGGSGRAIVTVASGALTITVSTVNAVFASLAGAVFKAASTGGQPKSYISSAWTRRSLKLGTTAHTVKRHNGSAWVALS